MVNFSTKKIEQTVSAFVLLTQTREKLGMTLNTVAKTLGIAPRFVSALEECHLKILPGEFYVKNFLKKYCGLLKLDSTEFLTELEKMKKNNTENANKKCFVPVCRLKNNPLLLRRVIFTSIFLVLLLYLGVQINGIFTSPELSLETPDEGFITELSKVAVMGKTIPETVVKINGAEKISDVKGKFSETIDLNPGTNQIIVTVAKKHGRLKSITRNVIYKEKIKSVSLKN